MGGSMSGEMIAIVAVGVALAGVILTRGHEAGGLRLREDMAGGIAAARGQNRGNRGCGRTKLEPELDERIDRRMAR